MQNMLDTVSPSLLNTRSHYSVNTNIYLNVMLGRRITLVVRTKLRKTDATQRTLR